MSAVLCTVVLVAALQIYPRIVFVVHLAHVTAFGLPRAVLYVTADATAIATEHGEIVAPLT